MPIGGPPLAVVSLAPAARTWARTKLLDAQQLHQPLTASLVLLGLPTNTSGYYAQRYHGDDGRASLRPGTRR